MITREATISTAVKDMKPGARKSLEFSDLAYGLFEKEDKLDTFGTHQYY